MLSKDAISREIIRLTKQEQQYFPIYQLLSAFVSIIKYPPTSFREELKPTKDYRKKIVASHAII